MSDGHGSSALRLALGSASWSTVGRSALALSLLYGSGTKRDLERIGEKHFFPGASHATAPADKDVFVLDLSALDPVTGQVVRTLVSSSTFSTGTSDDPANVSCNPSFSVVGFGSSIFQSDTRLIGGMTDQKSGEFRFLVAHPSKDATTLSPEEHALAREAWSGRMATVWKIAKGTFWADRTVHARGTVVGVTASENEIAGTIASFNAVLATKKLSEGLFWGRPRGLKFGGIGSGQYVSFGDVLDQTGSCSYQFVLRVDSYQSTYSYIMDKGQGGVGSVFIMLGGGDNTTVDFSIDNAGNRWTVSGRSRLQLGRVYELTCVHNAAADTSQIYLDAVEDGAITGATVDAPNTTGALNWARSANDAGHEAAITILEGRVWSKALSQEEIRQYQYIGPLSSSTSALVGWWRFAESAGATLNDETASNADGTINGATRQYFLYNTAAPDSAHGQLDTTATTAATTATGWTVGAVAAPNFSLGLWGLERAAATFGPTALPNAAPTPTDCLRTRVPVTGTFAAGNWSVAIGVRAVDLGGAQDGRVRVRIWYSESIDGSNAIEITTATGVGTAVTNLAVGVTQTSTATCTCAAVNLVDCYVFIQHAWEITGAGGGAAADVLLRAQESSVTTTVLQPAWVATYEGDFALAGRGKPLGMGWVPLVEPLLIDHQWLIYMVSSRGIDATGAFTIYDGGVAITRQYGRNDLGAGAVASGSYQYDQARGLVRLGTSPALRFSAILVSPPGADEFQGHGHLRTVHGIAGFQPWQFDVDFSRDFKSYVDQAAVDGGSGISGYWTSDASQVTCADVVQSVAVSYRCGVGFDFDGVLRAKALNAGDISSTPAVELTANDIAPGSLTVIAVLPAVKEVLVHSNRYIPPHGVSEIAGAVGADQRAALQREWKTARYKRTIDAYGNDFEDYGEDARRIEYQTMHLAHFGGPPVVQAQGLLDTHDRMNPIYQVTIVSDQRPKIGDTVRLTVPQQGLEAGGKCMCVGVTRDTPDEQCVAQLLRAEKLAA